LSVSRSVNERHDHLADFLSDWGKMACCCARRPAAARSPDVSADTSELRGEAVAAPAPARRRARGGLHRVGHDLDRLAHEPAQRDDRQRHVQAEDPSGRSRGRRRWAIPIRFQGGNNAGNTNAGNTIVRDSVPWKFHLIPSRIIDPGKLCAIGNGVVIDSNVLRGERDELRAKGG
jgi:hypothetical protein